jgi:hypothetical protein
MVNSPIMSIYKAKTPIMKNRNAWSTIALRVEKKDRIPEGPKIYTSRERRKQATGVNVRNCVLI